MVFSLCVKPSNCKHPATTRCYSNSGNLSTRNPCYPFSAIDISIVGKRILVLHVWGYISSPLTSDFPLVGRHGETIPTFSSPWCQLSQTQSPASSLVLSPSASGFCFHGFSPVLPPCHFSLRALLPLFNPLTPTFKLVCVASRASRYPGRRVLGNWCPLCQCSPGTGN